AFDHPGVDLALELFRGHTVVNHSPFILWQIIHPHQFPLQSITYRDYTIGAVRAVPFVVANSAGWSVPEMVSAAAIFGGMHRQDPFVIRPAMFDPRHRIRAQPVVGVDDIEMADVILGLEEMPNKGAAHFLDFIHEIVGVIERAVMVPDPVNLAHAAASVPG